MNYQKIYNQIIERAGKRKLTCYKERHHIIPRCLGGNNDKSNLAELTAKEHFICHRLLTLIYPENSKLKYALWCMCTLVKNTQLRYKVTARVYQKLKEEYSIVKSESQKGKPSKSKGIKRSEETRQKLKDAKRRLYESGYISHSKGKKLDFKQIWISKGMTKEETQEKWDKRLKQQSELMKRETNPFRTLEQTPERRKMLAERAVKTFTGTTQSEEHKRKRSDSYKETYSNSSEEQKLQRSKINKLNALKGAERFYKNYIIIYQNKQYKFYGGLTDLSEFLLKELNLKARKHSLGSYLSGNTKSFKNAPSLTIILGSQSNT